MISARHDTHLEKAVTDLLKTLLRTAWRARPRRGVSSWEACYGALVLLLNPRQRAYEVLETLPAGSRPMDDVDVLGAAANLGYFSRAVKLSPAATDPRLMPCLFTPPSGGAFILMRRDADRIIIYDGRARRVVTHNIADSFCRREGRGWVFTPYDSARQCISRFMRQGTGYGWFRALVSRFSGTFVQVLLSGIVLNVVALASPLYMMAVYDLVISPADPMPLIGLSIGVLIAIMTEYLLRGVRSGALSWLSARLDTLVGTRIFSHLIGLPPDLIERASVAAQVARIKTFESVRDLFSGAVFLSFLEIPYVVLALALIWAVGGLLVLVPMLMLGAFAALFVVMRRRIKTVIRLAAKASSGRQQFTIETFEKMRGIRANGLTGIWERKFNDLASQEIVMNFHLGWLGTVAETLAHALTLLAAVMTVGVGAHLVWVGSMTTGALIASMMLVWRVLTPFYSLCAMIPRLEQLRNSVMQVDDLMELETEAESARAAARLPSLRGNITFAGVSFGYDAGKDPVFGLLDFDVKPGGFVAVLGRNGAGKTSLLKLAKGLYRPASGSVRVDGFDIRQLDPVHLRRQIAYIPQRPEFFSATVIDNLRVAHPLATEKEVEQALALADALADVRAMPQGLDTIVAPGQLSATLAARLSLARAYLHGGPVLLIDELPGSLLNGTAGRNLRRYLEKSKGQRTIIMVTHRDDVLAMADLIVELRRGELPRYIGATKSSPLLKESA